MTPLRLGTLTSIITVVPAVRRYLSPGPSAATSSYLWRYEEQPTCQDLADFDNLD